MEQTETTVNDLWQHYFASQSDDARNRLVDHYLHLVKIATDRISRDVPQHIDRDELIGAGVLGLMQAIEKFDPKQNVKFETYSMARIRGAILDELRSYDWMPRPLRTLAHQVKKVQNALQQRLGRKPTDQEVTGKLDVTDREYTLIAKHAWAPAALSLHAAHGECKPIDILEDQRVPNPSEVIEKQEIRDIVFDVIKSLETNDRLIILLYYYDRLTMRQIGEVLQISESRICQVHNKVLTKLQLRLKTRFDEAVPVA